MEECNTPAANQQPCASSNPRSIHHTHAGIILKAFSLGDYDQILTVFTREVGLLKLVVKGAYSRRKGHGASTEPFTLAEFTYISGRGELQICRDLSLLDRHLQLRERWENLQAAGIMTRALLATQKLSQPSPLVYDLFTQYLNKIAAAPSPEVLSASLQLKLLRHEGLIVISPHCHICQNNTLAIASGQSYCQPHAPLGALAFTSEEVDLLLLLTYSRSLTTLLSLESNTSFLVKVHTLFDHTLHDAL